MDDRRLSRIGEEFRGMSTESAIIIEQLQAMENRTLSHLDKIQGSIDKMKDQTAQNEIVLTDHSARIRHSEQEIKDTKQRNDTQHQEFYNNFKTVEARLHEQSGKSSMTPILISVIGILTALASALYSVLK